jgi:hypothetical protein
VPTLLVHFFGLVLNTTNNPRSSLWSFYPVIACNAWQYRKLIAGKLATCFQINSVTASAGSFFHAIPS